MYRIATRAPLFSGSKSSLMKSKSHVGTITELARRNAENQYRSFRSSKCWQANQYEDVKVEVMESNSPQTPSRWSDMFQNSSPVLIRGLVNNWPAVSNAEYKWVNGKRFEEVDKSCFVPIEIGRNYMDQQLSIAHMEFGEVASFLLNSGGQGEVQTQAQTDKKREIDQEQARLGRGNNSKGREKTGRRGKLVEVEVSPYAGRTFLAQHALSEIPSLEQDASPMPDLVKTGKGHLYRTNIWLGGSEGSESPCHKDPFHNILCQVFGQKTVLLFPPSEHEHLYLAMGSVQQNTSLVDFKHPDLLKHPLFAQAKGMTATLSAGDGLYIPKGWFHYCCTEDKSCSVNFWWL